MWWAFREACPNAVPTSICIYCMCWCLASVPFNGSSLFVPGDFPPNNGEVSAGQYSTVSPPGSPTDQEEPFSTYFAEKVAIPEDANQV